MEGCAPCPEVRELAVEGARRLGAIEPEPSLLRIVLGLKRVALPGRGEQREVMHEHGSHGHGGPREA
jgi:hypothetical protein